MTKVGLLSDTHGHVDDAIFRFFSTCDEIWHAGDIGSIQVLEKLAAFKPTKAVYGNIDGIELRKMVPEHLIFNVENIRIVITHIGGYPNNYSATGRKLILEHSPDLFVCGHSHILKVMPDSKHKLLHINPGAAGNSGWHKVKTLVKFAIDGKNYKDLEVMEIKRN